MSKSNRIKKTKELNEKEKKYILDKDIKKIKEKYNENKFIGKLMCKLDVHLYKMRTDKKKTLKKFENACYFLFVAFFGVYILNNFPLSIEIILGAYDAILVLSLYHLFNLYNFIKQKIHTKISILLIIFYIIISFYSIEVIINVFK